MRCNKCGEPIPEKSVVFHGHEVICAGCSGQEVALDVERDVPGPNENTARADLALASELISGAGQLKGQKIERAKIVYYLRNDLRLFDAADAVEQRKHWKRREGLYSGE